MGVKNAVMIVTVTNCVAASGTYSMTAGLDKPIIIGNDAAVPGVAFIPKPTIPSYFKSFLSMNTSGINNIENNC